VDALGKLKDTVANVGEAMRRRLQLVPFEIVIPDRDRDHDLQAKLLDERDGILSWMVAGCAEWLRVGLAAPECARSGGASYFANEDHFGQWINECCEEARATGRCGPAPRRPRC
jgi:putative DNA primase/helicase